MITKMKMFQRKRYWLYGFLLVAASGLIALSPHASAQTGGLKPLPERSKEEIISRWNEWMTEADSIPSIYVSEPRVQAPYEGGKVKEEVLQSGLNAANFFRFLAGFDQPLKLDDSLNDIAQHAAVLLSAHGELTHTPPKPDDMDQAFYERGYKGTSSSNLAVGTGIAGSVRAYMDDSDRSNMHSLGHRRWILNPKLERVGFGAARKETTQTFSAMYVLDYDRNKRADYSYILYPNGGAFPLEVFDESKIWSVQLNPAEFQAPEFGKVQVTMTRLSDGRTWQINAQSSARAAEKARHHDTLTFFTTDGQIYGESHAVIFRPEMRPIMDGDRFRIRIEGLKRIDGKEAEITYETEFFSITGNKRPSLLRFEPPADVILNAGESLDVPSFVAYYSNGSYEVKEEVELSVLSGPAAIHGRQIIGKDEGTAVIEARFGHATATFQVAVQTPSQFTDIRGHWAEDTIRDAVEHHRVSGYDDGTFRPDNFVTEQEFLAMIFKWFSDEPLMVQVASFYTSYQGNHWSDLYYAYASSFRLIPMSDHRREHEMEYRSHELTRAEVAQLLSRLAGRNYADDRDAIQFLLNMGFATGKTGNSVEGFRGEDKLTRAEAVTFLKNAKENGLAFRLRSDQPEVMSERERNGAWPDLMFRTRYRDDGELILEGYDYEKAGGSLKVNIARRKSSVFSEYLATVQVPVDENGYFRSSFTGFEENVLLLYIEFAENILSYTEIERGNSRIDVGHR